MAPSPTPFSTFMIQFAADPLPRAPRNAPCDRTRRDARLFCMWGRIVLRGAVERDCEAVRNPDIRTRTHGSPDWSDGERRRTYIQEVGFKHGRWKTMRPRWGFENISSFFSGVEESPSSGVGFSRGGDKGMESVMRPLFEKICEREVRWC